LNIFEKMQTNLIQENSGPTPQPQPTPIPMPNPTSQTPSVKRQSGMEKIEEDLQKKLIKYKDEGVLVQSLMPQNVDSEFEVLEFYGDSVLYEKLSNLLLKTRRFLKPGLLTKMRSHCVCNNNLAICYVNLKMEQLLNSHQIPCTTKGQADVMESILGELSEKIESGKNAELKTFLEALIGYILYTGEKNYFLNEQQHLSADISNGPPANSIERNKSGARELSPQSKFPQRKPSPHHGSDQNKSPQRRSPRNKSPQRRSPRNKSPRNKSPQRGTSVQNGTSPQRRSPRNKSPQRGTTVQTESSVDRINVERSVSSSNALRLFDSGSQTSQINVKHLKEEQIVEHLFDEQKVTSKTSKGTPPPKTTLPLPLQSKGENPFTIQIPVPDPPTWQDLLNWSNSK